MHWFYVKDSQIENGHISLRDDSVNHIKNVLRMRAGEKIILCNQEGTDYLCELESIMDNEITARILSSGDSESELGVKITLFQGIPKKDKMEFIIQKAVELGVYEIVPVAMKRCVAKIEEGKKEEKKLKRWQDIAHSAAEQSKRGIVPRVRNVMSYREAVEYAKKNLSYNLFPYELASQKNSSYNSETKETPGEKKADTENVMEYTRRCIKDAAKQESVGIFIGPEGGFEDDEAELAGAAGFSVISLGKRILRTETAGLAVLSILMFEAEI